MNRRDWLKYQGQEWTPREVLLVVVVLALAVLLALYMVDAHAAPVSPSQTFADFLVWTVANPQWVLWCGAIAGVVIGGVLYLTRK